MLQMKMASYLNRNYVIFLKVNGISFKKKENVYVAAGEILLFLYRVGVKISRRAWDWIGIGYNDN